MILRHSEKQERKYMSNNKQKVWGLSLIIISIFLLLSGLYLPAAVFSVWLLRILDIAGLVMLAGGIILYKVVS